MTASSIPILQYSRPFATKEWINVPCERSEFLEYAKHTPHLSMEKNHEGAITVYLSPAHDLDDIYIDLSGRPDDSDAVGSAYSNDVMRRAMRLVRRFNLRMGAKHHD